MSQKRAVSGQDPIVDGMTDLNPGIPESLVSDEGVPYQWMTPALLVNQSSDVIASRKRVLHVAGKPFAHVSDTVDGQWIYRHDD